LSDFAKSLAVYFGGKRVGTVVNGATGSFTQDRLGSNGSYYPYGEARGTVPQDDVGYATYTNDSATGLQYADQRYYASNFGRFMSPDRHRPRNGIKPLRWNRYTYVLGDPINLADPRGRDDCDVDGGECGPDTPIYYGDDGGTSDDTGDDTPGDDGGGDPCAPNGGEGLVGDPTPEAPDPVCYAPEPPPPPSPTLRVTSVDVTKDCWLNYNPQTGAPSRETDFTAFDGSTDLAGENITITESVTWSVGGRLATGIIGDPDSSGTGGVFNDEKGLNMFQQGVYTVYQSFVVSVNGGAPYAVPIVLANGTTVPYLTVQLSGTYGSFWNWLFGKKSYNVTVNGQGKSALQPCN